MDGVADADSYETGAVLSAALATEYVDIRGDSIDLDASGGSIGSGTNALEIDSARD